MRFETEASDPREFRNALGMFATGVTVVTALNASGQPRGITANSFSSVSLDPMLVLWSVDRNASSYDVFSAAERFAINVLTEEQQALSKQFAANERHPFDGVPCSPGRDGVPILADCAAVFECTTEHRYDGGDHLILVGRVRAFTYRDGTQPLIYHGGEYARLSNNG